MSLPREGFGFEDVDLIVVSQQGIDHDDGLDEARRRSGVLVLAHANEVPYVEGEVADGVRLRTAVRTVRLVAPLGHSPGYVSVYVPDEEVLLAADAITAEPVFTGLNGQATVDTVWATRTTGCTAELYVEWTPCSRGDIVDCEPERIRQSTKHSV